MVDLPLITIPPSGPHTHTVILLHRRGSTARDLVSNLHSATDSRWWSLIENYGSVRWVFPQRPPQQPSILYSTAYSGFGFRTKTEPQWFDEWDGTEAGETKVVEGLRDSVLALRRVVASEAAMLRGRWNRVVLGGMDHGAGAALHTLINLEIPREGRIPDGPEQQPQPPRRLGAFLGVSSLMPFARLMSLTDTRKLLSLDKAPGDDDDEVVRNTPMLLEHVCHGGEASASGDENENENENDGDAFRESVVGFGAPVCWKEYEDGWPVLHSPTGVDDIKAFFLENLELRPN